MPKSTPPSARAAELREELLGADLTAGEVAHVLGLDEATVRRRLNDGTLPGYRLGREWRTTEDTLRRYVAQIKGERKPPLAGPGSPAPGGSSTITWGPGTVQSVPSVTHPIGATVTYNAWHDPLWPMDIDEP